MVLMIFITFPKPIQKSFMKNIRKNSIRLLTALVAGLFVSAGAMAEKPDWAEGGKNGKFKQSNKQERREKSSESRQERGDRYFGDEQRTVITRYYTEQYRVGRCPPGLAKKQNGCMPPGQAKKWVVGRPLPREVVYYDLPPSVVLELGAPRAGQRYVRVASDILLIAIGTGMVLDGIENLGR
jgi:Ni/Co efflux regulator RcnB